MKKLIFKTVGFLTFIFLFLFCFLLFSPQKVNASTGCSTDTTGSDFDGLCCVPGIDWCWVTVAPANQDSCNSGLGSTNSDGSGGDLAICNTKQLKNTKDSCCGKNVAVSTPSSCTGALDACYSDTTTSWMTSCGGNDAATCNDAIGKKHLGLKKYTDNVCVCESTPFGGTICSFTFTYSANYGLGDTCHSEANPVPHGDAPGYCDGTSGGVGNLYKVCCNWIYSEACSGTAHDGDCPHSQVRCNRTKSQCTYSTADTQWHYNSDWSQICDFNSCPSNTSGADTMCKALFCRDTKPTVTATVDNASCNASGSQITFSWSDSSNSTLPADTDFILYYCDASVPASADCTQGTSDYKSVDVGKNLSTTIATTVGDSYKWYVTENNCAVATPSQSTVFDKTCSYNATAHVFMDNQKIDGLLTAGEPAFTTGASIKSSGGNPTTPQTTDANGNVSIATILPGNDDIALTIPANFAYSPAAGNPLPSGNPLVATIRVKGPPDQVANFGLVPAYSISGFVYVDANKSFNYDNPPDYPYIEGASLNVSICPSAGNAVKVSTFCVNGGHPTPVDTTPAGLGKFAVGRLLPAGEYEVKLLAPLPDISYQFSGVQSYEIVVGTPNQAEPKDVPDADAIGNVANVPFGITDSNTWIQTTGGDLYNPNGVTNVMPAHVPLECGGPIGHMSIAAATITSPGIVFSGLDLLNFGVGDASVNKWVAVDIIKPKIKTSYQYLYDLVTDPAQTTPIDLSTDICPDLTNCTLPDNLPKGVYIAKTALTIGSGSPSTYTFPAKSNFVILVNGDLTLASNIIVPHSSTVIFSASGDIHVDKTIGTTYKDNTPNIEGYYSTDKNFYVDSYGPKNCPTTPDKRLNIEGAIVANAIYDTSAAKGSLQVNRDMCEGDVCPTFSVKARTDFVLNAPLLYQYAQSIEEEKAP